ncbi:exopolysaccharide transport family protein [Flavimarina sp. Hel_I_48]|uniref:exopolysaccharide transport family protein n=1 Tax=Flavimarina sp. Hel_I_48 TaxID=1392488 RepID=UPI00068A9960|nr:tyrosine-protein kinase [Flavimarina sp. Hel_I_48]
MEDGFEIKDQQHFFDFRGFLIKILRYWPLFIISLSIAFYIAYYINIRKETVYRLSNMISVKDDQNPFFTSNTSLTFNWGGTTDKVQTALIFLKSRSHNEKVVEKLQFYVAYLKQGEYNLLDVYDKTPFKVDINTAEPQLLNTTITIEFVDASHFDLKIALKGGDGMLQNYSTKEKIPFVLPSQDFIKRYALGDPVDLPFLNFKVQPTDIIALKGQKYLLKLSDFDATVSAYRNLSVEQTPSGSSIMSLTMEGTNKYRIVDYLNTSVEVLSTDQLERKNLFATKTIKFIDSSLANKSSELKNVQQELNAFRENNTSVGISGSEESLIVKVSELDTKQQQLEQQLQYYRNLEDYLITRTDYSSNIPAPSLTGIGEGSISQQVSNIIALSEQRKRLSYSAKPGNPIFNDLDRRINAIKTIVLENISSSKEILNSQLNSIRQDIGNVESQMRKLPAEQQQLLGIQRKYNLSENTYSIFLAKRSEAGIIKSANVSDIQVIDPAKDIGGGAVGPDTKTNYIMAAIAGSAVPMIVVFLLVFFDNKINNPDELKQLSEIPVLGAIGKSSLDSNLVLLDKPKSAVAEAFRAIRSSLQFIYRRQKIDGAKTVMVTSSVGGEGKTFCSMNLATVFALSERRTVLVGLDLRKPKIYDDFSLDKNIGVVNYLIGDKSYEEIKQPSHLPYLDIILAGPVPPNPSELLMSDQMDALIAELKKNYDYIILDTPPVGLVADALELQSYVDATLYVIRQDYTKKGMLANINEKYKRGEVKNISFVLNYFRTKGKLGYNYGYGYGYGSYAEGYHEDEKTGFFSKILKNVRGKSNAKKRNRNGGKG